MVKWLTKREDYEFETSDNSARNQLHNAVAKEGQDGWEPWHMAGAYLGKEFVTVWYKRPE